MRKLVTALAATAALLSAPALHAREKQTGEETLAKILEGRVAGEPGSCISLHQTRDTKVIDRTAIVYDAGSVIYVNRPTNARALDSDDILVTDIRGGSQLCNVDVVRLHDRSGFWYTGFVGLEKFVPYRRVAKAD